MAAKARIPMTAQQFWRKLKEIGWLDHVPKSKQAAMRKNIETLLNNPKHCIQVFEALTQHMLDMECIYDSGPDKLSYHQELLDLAKNSRGLFRPTEIKDEFNESSTAVTISFRHDGKLFSCTVAYESDWFDMAVLKLVNRALKTSGIQERFIPLPEFDQCLYLVLVPTEVYRAAVREKLIPTQGQLDRMMG